MKRFFTLMSLLLVSFLFVTKATAVSLEDISMTLKGIGTSKSSFSDINQYVAGSGVSYEVTGNDIYVRGVIYNNTNQILQMNAARIKVAFLEHDSPFSTTCYDMGGSSLTNFSVYPSEGFDIVIKLPSNWRLTNGKLNLYFVYTEGSGGYFCTGSYNVTKAKASSLSAVVTSSDVTLKSMDEGTTIQSVQVIGTAGNVVKTKSFGSNCTEANVDLSNCRNGIYYLHVVKNNGTETVKIVKK